MKTLRWSVVLLPFWLICCKDNASGPAALLDYRGWVILSDSLDEPLSNHSGVKITVVQTGATARTDSSGHFLLHDLPQGIYDLKYEYSNFPAFYLEDLAINGPAGSLIAATDITELSPLPIHTFVLDSVSHDVEFTENGSDSVLIVFFHGLSPLATRRFNRVLISNKTPIPDYHSGNYRTIVGTNETWITPMNSTASLYPLSYSKLFTAGYRIGDSIYVRFYPLCSTAYYIDRATSRRVYPFIGAGSNILATTIR